MDHNGDPIHAELGPRSILASLSRSELERVLRERLDEGDEDLGELILALHADKSDRRSPSAIVDSLMRRHKVREYDLVDDPDGLARDLRRLYGRADDAAINGNQLFAVQLLARAIEGAAPHAFEGIDEEGEIMNAVEEGFGRLMEIARAPEADMAALRELGSWTRLGVEARWAREGDSWDMSCLELAAEAARGEEKVRTVLGLCSRFVDVHRATGDWNYRAEQASLIAAGLLGRCGTEEERRRYIEAHLALAGIRKLAVDEAMAAGDYSRAIGLCRDGINLSRDTGSRGTADELEERLIEALDRAGDTEKAMREFERFVTESFSVDRFSALKSRNPDRCFWIEVRDRIISALEKSRSSHALATIYEIEGMDDRLLVLAEKDSLLFSQHLDTIGRAYPERAARFLKKRVERELGRTASRGSYACSAESILRYGEYAGKEAAKLGLPPIQWT